MKIFISYRRKDAAYQAQRLHELLGRQFGNGSVYLDVATRRLGDFRVRVAEQLDRADAVIVVISQDWVGRTDDGSRRIDRANDPVRHEVTAALARDPNMVVPVLVDGAEMPQSSELPTDLELLPWCEQFELGRDSFEHDLAPVIELLRAVDPDARQAENQLAAVIVGGTTKWLLPEPSATLRAGSLAGTTAPAGSSIALSADGLVVAHVIDAKLTVYALAEPTTGTYERWQHFAVDESWRNSKMVAVRRRGIRAVQVALSYESSRSRARKVVLLDVSHRAATENWSEIDGTAVVGAFHRSSLLYVDPGSRQVWEWRQEEQVARLWPANPGVHARWLDGATNDGDALLAVLGDRPSGAASDAWVVLIADEDFGPQDSRCVQPRSHQVVVPRNLDGSGPLRVLVKGTEWTDVLD